MSTRTLSIPSYDSSEFARESGDCRKSVMQMLGVMERLLALKGRGIGKAIAEEAARLELSSPRLRAIYDVFRVSWDWRDLINRSKYPAPGVASVLPRKLIELFHALCLENQRGKFKPAWRELIRKWKRKDPVDFEWPPIDPVTSFPMGCTYRNLIRHAPTKYELKAATIGKSAASGMLPKVLSTRVGIEIGQVFVNDDQDYDVNIVFEGVNRKYSRPSGFNTLDYASACDVLQGFRPTIIHKDGTKEKLKQIDYQWHLVSLFTTVGYRADIGTLVIDEHGTAKAGDEFWDRVGRATGGKVSRIAGGIQGDQIAGMFRGQPRGNPRFKAARESFFNLLRNEMAALPGPTGKDRDHAPEENYGMEKYVRDLLDAIVERPDLAGELMLPVLRWGPFVQAAGLIHHAINTRDDHDLEGWSDHMAWEWRLQLPAPGQPSPWLTKAQYLELPSDARAIADAMIQKNPLLSRSRRLQPWERWISGRHALTRIEGPMVPILLGPEGARSATVTNDHHLIIEDMEVEPEEMWFDAALTNGRILKQGQSVIVYLNPFLTSELGVCESDGRWLGTAPRVNRPCKLDVESLKRRYGQVKAIESKLLAPVAKAGADKLRERTKMREHNAGKIDGRTAEERRADERKQKSAARFGEIVLRERSAPDTNARPATDPAAPASPATETETWDAAPSAPQTTNSTTTTESW